MYSKTWFCHCAITGVVSRIWSWYAYSQFLAVGWLSFDLSTDWILIIVNYIISRVYHRAYLPPATCKLVQYNYYPEAHIPRCRAATPRYILIYIAGRIETNLTNLVGIPARIYCHASIDFRSPLVKIGWTWDASFFLVSVFEINRLMAGLVVPQFYLFYLRISILHFYKRRIDASLPVTIFVPTSCRIVDQMKVWCTWVQMAVSVSVEALRRIELRQNS